MKAGRIITVLVLAGLVVLAGCKKKPKTVPPPAAQAPPIAQPQPLPPTQPTQPPPETQPAPTTAPPALPVEAKPKPKPKKPVAKKTVPTTPNKPTKTVIEEGGASAGGQLSAAIPHDEAVHQKLSTAQLLEEAEATLKSVNRMLTKDEQAMVQQIRDLVQQSRAASNEGDTQRAYNLALKAHLLSDELAKPR